MNQITRQELIDFKMFCEQSYFNVSIPYYAIDAYIKRKSISSTIEENKILNERNSVDEAKKVCACKVERSKVIRYEELGLKCSICGLPVANF